MAVSSSGGLGANASPIPFEDCQFISNVAYLGGALYTDTAESIRLGIQRGNEFVHNVAYLFGGAINLGTVDTSKTLMRYATFTNK